MRSTAVAVTVLAALASLAGCGGGTATSTTAPPAAPTTTSASAPTKTDSADPAKQAAFVAALDAIDKDIAHGKAEKAYDRGRNQCDSIKNNPNDRAKLLDLTRQRFTSPDHPEGFPPATVEKILDAVKTHLCP
ncbi:hypothetical protein AB0M48_11010 [Lentzea sp. NPDC051208]|uniref:hypothetical protein n=1 Tax=Lentzea sp. NPDC051208 TaxID=3154642 RepID=UPI003416223A